MTEPSPLQPRIEGVVFSPDGIRAVLRDAPEVATALGSRFTPTHLTVSTLPDKITAITLSALTFDPVAHWTVAEYRSDKPAPLGLESVPAWLSPLIAGFGITIPEPVEASTFQIEVSAEKRRDFEGFEMRIEVTGAPTLHDLLPPYREFNPGAVLVLHYAHGHWSDHTPYTHVTVVGGCVDDDRRPGRVEWHTDRKWLWDYEGDMPDWLREFVRERTGIDLSGWRPEVIDVTGRRAIIEGEERS